jgi:hypothetical protein
MNPTGDGPPWPGPGPRSHETTLGLWLRRLAFCTTPQTRTLRSVWEASWSIGFVSARWSSGGPHRALLLLLERQ